MSKFIQINSKVKIKNGKHSYTYQIVTPDKVNPSKKLISSEAPLGKSLLNHEENEEINVQTPSGIQNFHIVSIF